MLSKETLKRHGEAGLIPGPDESEEDFVKRVDTLLSSKQEAIDGKPLEPWDLKNISLLGARPSWIPLTYSNQGLLPWQGAALWVFGQRFPMIQLRKRFKRGRFLFYKHDEVLHHETIHAIRYVFKEPRFEELLAYAHSHSKWRRFIGPLFRKPSQAIFFISLIFTSLLIQFTSLFFISSPFLPLVKFVSLLPLIDLVFRFASLLKDQRILKRAMTKLALIFPNQKSVFPILLRLKDIEIQRLALDPVEKFLDDFEKKVPHSVRIRQILAQFC